MNEQAAVIVNQAKDLFEQLAQLNDNDRMDAINEIRLALHEHSPMKQHPVDCVLWIEQDKIKANVYNPNRVAPPEMVALQKSIETSGYTQPSVTWKEDEETQEFEIIDGYHRWLISKVPAIYASVQGRLPITIANPERTGKAARMGATILHNEARGETDYKLLQEMIIDVVNSGMSDKWIMENFGMDKDKLLRLKHLTGLVALFKDQEFSRSLVTVERGIEEVIYE